MTAAGTEPSTLERAIQLARTSSCTNLGEIRKTLRREGFDSVDQHLSGSTIRKALQQQIADRRRGEAGS